jgi:hypothetical protein
MSNDINPNTDDLAAEGIEAMKRFREAGDGRDLEKALQVCVEIGTPEARKAAAAILRSRDLTDFRFLDGARAVFQKISGR